MGVGEMSHYIILEVWKGKKENRHNRTRFIIIALTYEM